jgi:hypothetical protein
MQGLLPEKETYVLANYQRGALTTRADLKFELHFVRVEPSITNPPKYLGDGGVVSHTPRTKLPGIICAATDHIRKLR